MSVLLISRRYISPRLCAFVPLRFIFFALSMLFFSSQYAHSADITFEWNPNTEPDLAGYRIFCRQEGQSYDYNDPAWEGIETTCTIYNLDDKTTYYFVARAFDTFGNESADSDEVWYDPFVAECEGDFDNDGDIDGYDLAPFCSDFGRTDCLDPGVLCECDLDQDGVCDGLDLAIFSESWGRIECQAGL